MDNLNPPVRLLAGFHNAFPGQTPAFIVNVPGREMWVAAASTDWNDYTLHAPDLEGRTRFSLRSAKFKQTVLKRPLPRWAYFPAGVILALTADGLDVSGVSAVIVGDETHGIRYEYALGMTVAALWHTILERPYNESDLTDIVERVRRDYVQGK